MPFPDNTPSPPCALCGETGTVVVRSDHGKIVCAETYACLDRAAMSPRPARWGADVQKPPARPGCMWPKCPKFADVARRIRTADDRISLCEQWTVCTGHSGAGDELGMWTSLVKLKHHAPYSRGNISVTALDETTRPPSYRRIGSFATVDADDVQVQPKCTRCGDRLVFSARQRGDGLCGSCSRTKQPDGQVHCTVAGCTDPPWPHLHGGIGGQADRCVRCGAILFAARVRDDGLCHPCSQQPDAPKTLEDAKRAARVAVQLRTGLASPNVAMLLEHVGALEARVADLRKDMRITRDRLTQYIEEDDRAQG